MFFVRFSADSLVAEQFGNVSETTSRCVRTPRCIHVVGDQVNIQN